jgi:hypothetical protein
MEKFSESGRELIVAQGYIIDEELLEEILKEVSETFDELGLSLPETKKAALIADFYKFTIEHNKKGSSLKERIVAFRKNCENMSK